MVPGVVKTSQSGAGREGPLSNEVNTQPKSEAFLKHTTRLNIKVMYIFMYAVNILKPFLKE